LANGVIEVRHAVKHFGEVRAVDDVTLTVQQGEIFGLIGHNGAGKSTLFRLMLGLMPLTAGDIRVNGQPIHGRAFREVRRRVGYLPENVVFYENLSGLETLHFFADLKGVDRSTCMSLLRTVGLEHAAQRRVRGYSKGMRQRLGFAQAMLGDPALLFLDEPTTGLDPEGIRDFYRILAEMRSRGVSMILSSHILAEIQERVDRLAMIRNGRIQAVGTVPALREVVDLPLQFTLVPRPGATAERLEAALAKAGRHVERGGQGEFLLECPRREKMSFLEALAPLMADIADFQIREPSLEDVFLGYCEEPACLQALAPDRLPSSP
jgi:Cu-processing system ATP-binding protein